MGTLAACAEQNAERCFIPTARSHEHLEKSTYENADKHLMEESLCTTDSWVLKPLVANIPYLKYNTACACPDRVSGKPNRSLV